MGIVLKLVLSQSAKYKARTENSPFLGPLLCSCFSFGPNLSSIPGEGSLHAVLNHMGRSWTGSLTLHLKWIHSPCKELSKTPRLSPTFFYWILKKILLVIIIIITHLCVRQTSVFGAHAMVYTWISEDDFLASFLSFHLWVPSVMLWCSG